MKFWTVGGILASLLCAGPVSLAQTEPPKVTLADYAFDFPVIGHEITVTGTAQNLADKLTADDYISITDDGYSLRTLIDRMGRMDRRGFIQFYNQHCIGFMPTDACAITASGDIELDEDMRMIFRMSTATISNAGNDWTNAP